MFVLIFLPFFDSLVIICGANQRPVSKSMYASLITVLSSTCFHYRCAASLILTSTVPGVSLVTIGIGQKQVRPINDLFYWFSSDLLSPWAKYLIVSKSSEFNVNVFLSVRDLTLNFVSFIYV